MGVGTSHSRKLAATEDGPALGLPGDLRHSQAWARLKRGVRNNLAPGNLSPPASWRQKLAVCLDNPHLQRVWPGRPWARSPSPGSLLLQAGKGCRQGLCGPPKAGARSWDKTGSDPQPPLSGRGLGHPLLSPDTSTSLISAIHQGHLDQPVLPETGSGHGGPSLEVCSGEPPTFQGLSCQPEQRAGAWGGGVGHPPRPPPPSPVTGKRESGLGLTPLSRPPELGCRRVGQGLDRPQGTWGWGLISVCQSHQDPDMQGLRPPQAALEGGLPMFPPPDRTQRSVPKVTRGRNTL